MLSSVQGSPAARGSQGSRKIQGIMDACQAMVSCLSEPPNRTILRSGKACPTVQTIVIAQSCEPAAAELAEQAV